MRLLSSLVFVSALLVVSVPVACGGDDYGGGATGASTGASAAAPPAGPVAVNVMTVDNSFSPATVNARAGEKVMINVKNDGQRPHSFTIDGVVDTGRLNAGESKTVEFTPSSAGSLAFYCTIHGAAVMSGTINVSASAVAEGAAGVEMAFAP